MDGSETQMRPCAAGMLLIVRSQETAYKDPIGYVA